MQDPPLEVTRSLYLEGAYTAFASLVYSSLVHSPPSVVPSKQCLWCQLVSFNRPRSAQVCPKDPLARGTRLMLGKHQSSWPGTAEPLQDQQNIPAASLYPQVQKPLQPKSKLKLCLLKRRAAFIQVLSKEDTGGLFRLFIQ